jgi:hypothetical protein
MQNFKNLFSDFEFSCMSHQPLPSNSSAATVAQPMSLSSWETCVCNLSNNNSQISLLSKHLVDRRFVSDMNMTTTPITADTLQFVETAVVETTALPADCGRPNWTNYTIDRRFASSRLLAWRLASRASACGIEVGNSL